MWDAPGTRERTLMLKNCGKKCFLGPKKSFPICTRHTCKISPLGVLAAYKRAKQWKHASVINKVKQILKTRASSRRASRT